MSEKIIPLYERDSRGSAELTCAFKSGLDHSNKSDQIQAKGAHQAATQHPLCEVRVSCFPRQEADDGTMEVNFEYTGDPEVVAFLLEQARLSLESNVISDAD